MVPLRRSSPSLALRLPLDVAVLPMMRSRVRAYLRGDGVAEELVEDVVLCLQEACKNAIRFSDSRDGILLRVAPEPGALRVLVRDHGVGMEPALWQIKPAPLADHGRGLQIIASLMDEVYVRVDHGTHLRMVKYLRPARQAGAGGSLALSA
jgi:anti-sigma regulatory factor (Ser/Thr protein kinase)